MTPNVKVRDCPISEPAKLMLKDTLYDLFCGALVGITIAIILYYGV